jgi:PEP-CTERM motif
VNKTNLKGAFGRWALSMVMVGASLLVIGGAGLKADALFNQGGLVGPPGTPAAPGVQSYDVNQVRCDSHCAGAQFTVFDNFSVPTQGWSISKIEIADWFVAATYQSSTYSIWSGDPVGGTGILKATGSVAGILSLISGNCSLSNTQCLQLITLNLGTAVTLGAGTYYLGVTNTVSAGSTDRALISSANSNWEWSDGAINGAGTGWQNGTNNVSFTGSSFDTAFDVQGTTLPEPGSLTLMGLALAGLIFVLRRRPA